MYPSPGLLAARVAFATAGDVAPIALAGVGAYKIAKGVAGMVSSGVGAKRPRLENATIDSSGYIQLRKLRTERSGKRARRTTRITKLVESRLLTKIDRFQNMASVGATAGPYYLSFCKDDATATKYYYPWYCFDLTSLQKNVWGAQYAQAVPFLRLKRTNASQDFGWEAQTGYQNNGSTASKFWQVERAPYETDTNQVAYEKAYLDWADIRMTIWGAKNRPSSVEVMLCRFPNKNRAPSGWQYLDATETETIPMPSKPSTATGTSANDYAENQKFWVSQVDNLISNPNTVRMQADDQSGMVVLYRKKFDFNPTASYETDVAGHQVAFKVFRELNMLCDYRNDVDKGTIGAFTGVQDVTATGVVNQWVQSIGQTESTALLRNPESRLFLVIRGSTFPASALVTTDDLQADTAASFDLCIRRKMTIG